MGNRPKSAREGATEDPSDSTGQFGATDHELAAELAAVQELREKLEAELAEVAQFRNLYTAREEQAATAGFTFWHRCRFCLTAQWWDVRTAASAHCRTCESSAGSDWVYAMAKKAGVNAGIPEEAPDQFAYSDRPGRALEKRRAGGAQFREVEIPGAIGF